VLRYSVLIWLCWCLVDWQARHVGEHWGRSATVLGPYRWWHQASGQYKSSRDDDCGWSQRRVLFLVAVDDHQLSTCLPPSSVNSQRSGLRAANTTYRPHKSLHSGRHNLTASLTKLIYTVVQKTGPVIFSSHFNKYWSNSIYFTMSMSLDSSNALSTPQNAGFCI